MLKFSVTELLERLGESLQMTSLTGEVPGDRWIVSSDVHRPGLALAGFIENFHAERLQILGNTEIRYVQGLPESERAEAFRHVFRFEVPAVVLSAETEVPAALIEVAREFSVPVLQVKVPTIEVVRELTHLLEDKLAPTTTVHGSLVDVYGVGLMITGRSAIGKSETALDLVERGHRLVADDAVTVQRKADAVLIGSGNDLLRHRMEIRGIGIIDVQSLFGIRAIRAQKRVEVEVHLEEWDSSAGYERHGLEDRHTEMLGVEISQVVVPIFPGKNITVICETIALRYLDKAYGYDPAQHFNETLLELMRRKANLAVLARDDRE